MIIKVGAHTYNSADVPVAVILSELDLNQLVRMPRKTEPLNTTAPKYVFVKWPNDIQGMVLMNWMVGCITEVKLEPSMIPPIKEQKEDKNG